MIHMINGELWRVFHTSNLGPCCFVFVGSGSLREYAVRNHESVTLYSSTLQHLWINFSSFLILNSSRNLHLSSASVFLRLLSSVCGKLKAFREDIVYYKFILGVTFDECCLFVGVHIVLDIIFVQDIKLRVWDYVLFSLVNSLFEEFFLSSMVVHLPLHMPFFILKS